jgi:sigma-E factor negative regulatory protein RseB
MAAMKSWFLPWLCILCSQSVVDLAVAAPGEASGSIHPPALGSIHPPAAAPPSAQPPVPGESPPVLPAPILEAPTAGPLDWLDRIATASRQLNYVGTFSYQTGWRSETSRIMHRYDNGEERERLEVLDGSPREVLRQGNEIRCVLPTQRTVIIGQARARGGFPGLVQKGHVDLSDNYYIRMEEVAGRIAGYEARKLVFDPRDELRFGHVLWAEMQSGLLLKSQVLDGKGEVIEQFAFSDVRIGGEIGDELLESRVRPGEDWRMVDVGSDNAKVEDRWLLKEPVPGFALTTKVHHRQGGTLQMVFSDGLAAISVFIEPAEAGVEARGGFSGGGAVNVFERIAEGHRITVMGEVPASVVQRMAGAIEVAK